MESRYAIIKSFSQVKKLVKACLKTGIASIDYETNAEGIYNKTFRPTILSVTFQVGSGVSIPLCHHEYDNPHWKKWLLYFGRKVVENPKVTKVGWNLKFDLQIFELYGIYVRGTVLDGMLMKYLLNEERPNDLKSMVRRYLPEHGDYEKADKFDKIPWNKKPLEPLCKYGCQDTDYTLRLSMFFENKLIEIGMYPLLRHLIMPASRVLQHAEKTGLYLDRKFNRELLESYKPKIDQATLNCWNLPRVKRFSRWLIQERISKYISSIERELEDLDYSDPKDARKIASREQKISNIRAGVFTTKKELELTRDINLGSPVDLPMLLYSEKGFKFPIIKYTKDKTTNRDTDKPSTDEDTLVELRLSIKNPESPKAIFLDNLLKLRGLKKMYTTYIEGWHDKVQDDSKLHGRFLIHGCVTGNTRLIGKDRDIRIRDICPKKPGILNVEKDNIWILSHECTWEQVTHTINKGVQKAYKLTTDTGDVLKCTKEHKLLTTNGWKTVKEIYHKKLDVIMYDTSKFDISKPETGKSASEVVFKEIPNWNGYLVSNEGKVYSVKTPGGRGILDYNHPHELIPRERNKGRYTVYFRRGGKKYAFSVSRLVWSVFNNTEIPNDMVIDHINCDPSDNRPENLQCITQRENILRAYKYTRSIYTNGNINGQCKIGTKEVGEILKMYKDGYTQSEILHKFNISQKQVSGIILGQRRKEIYLTRIVSMEYIGVRTIYDLSVNNKHSYITRSNFINSNTTSGRLSSQEPNLQQIPKTSVDPNIKKQLVAPDGKLYMALDYSQAELRIMAHLSGDETYLEAFAKGQDPHLAIAAKKYGVSYEEAYKAYSDEQHPDHNLWKNRRKQAKQICFGIIYGIQKKLLAVKLSDPKAGIIVTPDEAQQQLNEFFYEHPKIKKFMIHQEKVLIKHGYIKSLFGRKRRLPQVYSDNEQEAAYAVRLSVNMPCQSAASDMNLFASVLNYWKMRQGKLPFMQETCNVHDATYYLVRPEYINTWVVHEIWETCRNPNTKEYFNFQIDDVNMSMDFVIGRSRAEELPFIPGYDYRKMLKPDFNPDEYLEEHRKYRGIEIEDYPKLYPEEIARNKMEFEKRIYER